MERNNGMATASMVVGIIAVVGEFVPVLPSWLVLVLGIVAVFLAAGALKECPSGAPGHEMAVAGLVLGIVATALSGLFMLCACMGCVALTGLLGTAALM